MVLYAFLGNPSGGQWNSRFILWDEKMPIATCNYLPHRETSQICGVDQMSFAISKPAMKKAGVSAGLSVLLELLELLNALDIQLPLVENKAGRTSTPII